MPFKGIVFDLNGVLLWDAPFHVQAWQAVAVDLRGFQLSDEEFADHVHGRPNSHVLSYIAGRDIRGKELYDLAQAKESMYRDLCLAHPDTFVLSPGAVQLLDAIAEKAIPHTIATASERTNLDFFVSHLGLGKWFDVRQIVYDDGLRPGKPAPDAYATAAGNLNLAPVECVVVEDANSGFNSARAAHIGYIVGLGPVASHPRMLADERVDAVIESLAQFPRQLLNGV
jgi:beta-phosphoglucomutase-like phosphatase (HAD superfamily)